MYYYQCWFWFYYISLFRSYFLREDLRRIQNFLRPPAVTSSTLNAVFLSKKARSLRFIFFFFFFSFFPFFLFHPHLPLTHQNRLAVILGIREPVISFLIAFDESPFELNIFLFFSFFNRYYNKNYSNNICKIRITWFHLDLLTSTIKMKTNIRRMGKCPFHHFFFLQIILFW